MTQNGPPKKDSEFLPNSAIETQKTQKLGVFAEILPPVEALIGRSELSKGELSRGQNWELLRSP